MCELAGAGGNFCAWGGAGGEGAGTPRPAVGGRRQRLAVRQHPAAAAKGSLGWTKGGSARLACGFGRRARTIGGTIQFGRRVFGATPKTATGTVALPSKNPAVRPKAVWVGRLSKNQEELAESARSC